MQVVVRSECPRRLFVGRGDADSRSMGLQCDSWPTFVSIWVVCKQNDKFCNNLFSLKKKRNIHGNLNCKNDNFQLVIKNNH